nr:ATP-dependent helicase [Ktedonobacterales bacterium]
TFTRAAAEEMKKRATAALRGRGKLVKDLKELRVVTFHGLGHLMLREKLEWTPQELNKALISGDPRQWLAEDILRPWRSNRTRGMNWNAPVADLLAAVDRAKEAQITPEASADFFRDDLILLDDMAKRYQEFFLAYEETKKKGKLYDLADLIYVPLGLLNSSPTYRKKWQGRFHYLQVDETQDTNPSQYQLIQYLAAPKQNVVIVGDPDQAIYGFRGSTPEESILSFRTMYPKGKIYPIEHNYRSTPQILHAANSLIAHNDAHEGFEKQLRPTQPDGPPVSVIAYDDQEREAEGIAEGIQRIVNETRVGTEPLSYKDVFVLSRTNHHLASLEITLARHHIPYRAVGGSSFFKRKTTRDILAYLALVDGMRQYEEYVARRNDPTAPRLEDIFTPVLVGEQDAAFRTVASIPSRSYAMATGKTSHRFTPTFFGMMAAFSGGKTLLQCCEEQPYSIPPEYQMGIKDFVALIRAVTHASHNHPAAAIRSIRELAYDAHLRQRDGQRAKEEDEAEDDEAARDDDGAKAEARFDELEEMTRIAGKHHTVRHFLQAMAQLKDQAEDASKGNRDCVQLMTIHKSKGLEQKVVFVMGLVEGIFPHRRSYTLDNSDGPVLLSGIAEERRLAYVAITRAQRQLYLTTLLRYRGVDATPSRFIHEAGLEATDEGEVLHPFALRAELEG